MGQDARISPALPPYSEAVQAQFDRLMPPGVPPLALFSTLARDERLFRKFMSAGLLDRGHLSLRDREIAIDRTTAICGSEYEWGVHITFFAEKVGLTPDQVSQTTRDVSDAAGWSPRDLLIIRLMDSLHQTATIEDALWDDLAAEFSEGALMELLMLAGFYHTVSYLTNGLRLPLEDWAARFPDS